jgi:hypothetical protein
VTRAELMGKVAAVALDGLSLPIAERESIHVHAMRAYGLTMIRESLDDMLRAAELLGASGCTDAAQALTILALDVAKTADLVPNPEGES